jgi:hypothetical protein
MTLFDFRRLAPATLVVALLATLVVVSAPSPACACSCAPITPAEAYRNADAVFLGHLVDRRVEHGLPWSGADDKAVLTFAVREVAKGKVQPRQEIVTAPDSASCGLELGGRGPYVVYARTAAYDPAPPPEEGQYSGSLCSGTALVTAELRRDLDRWRWHAVEPNEEGAEPSKPGTTEAAGLPFVAWLAGLGVLLVGLVRLLGAR